MARELLAFAGVVPVAVIAIAALADAKNRKKKGCRSPLGEKLLRPAGYTLARKAEDLGERLLAWLFAAYLTSLFAVGFLGLTVTDRTTQTLLLLTFGGCSAVLAVLAWRTLQNLIVTRRGLLGEQAVAEQLQLLTANGYQIFHDLQGEGRWNLDHIAVGPAGVFAVETKYRTKQPRQTGGPDHIVEVENGSINFPTFKDDEITVQAHRNSKWLADLLTKAVGEPVQVRPLVALPGWMVHRKEQDPKVYVLSGKEIPGYVRSRPTVLAQKLINQISYQLEQRCRDVEL